MDGRALSVALNVADELAVLRTDNNAHVLDASSAGRLANKLTACADAIDALQPDDAERTF